MSTEKMREEFEGSPRFMGMDFTRSKTHQYRYESPYANGAWDGWRASRAAIEVSLPAACAIFTEDSDRQAAELYENVARESIAAQGLRVKA